MARPTSITDLNRDQEAVRVATFKVEELVRLHNSALFSAYLAFAEAATQAGATFDDDYSGTAIYVPRASRDLERKLEDAQREYDQDLKRYMKALKSPDDPSESYFAHAPLRRKINEWAKGEGFEPIDWGIREDSYEDGTSRH